jgi:signal transduction histidine kinase
VEALHAVATAVSQSLEVDQMLNSVLEKVLDVTRVDAGYVTFFDVEARTGSVTVHQGLSEHLVGHLGQIRGKARAQDIRRWTENKEPAFGLCQMYREPLLGKLLATAEKEGLHSFVALPLWSKATLFGALVLASRSHRHFSTEDLELLKAIANQIAVGIENSRLFHKAQAQVEELKVAHEYFVQTEKRRALAEMAGGVAHDFNNFLAVILGRAQLALAEAKEPMVRKSLQVIEQSAQDAAKMVLRLQDSARAESYEEFQEFDPELLVLSALQMVETRRAESQLMGVKIDITADLGELSAVEGKAGELRQVMINIIFNAMDVLPHGGEITVKTRQENGWAVLSISDTGAGMTEDVKARIFDPFFTTKGAAGLGLGLSVSHGIVAEHGGSLEVDSAPGKGSTFTVRLPIANNARGKLLGGKGTSYTHTGAKILLVDDETEVVAVLGDMLHNLGYQVTAASSGREALDALRSEEYDLLITDLHMPGISGRDVANAFKQARPEMPILVITGWGLQIDRSELAADAVLAKPISKEILSREIAAVLT